MDLLENDLVLRICKRQLICSLSLLFLMLAPFRSFSKVFPSPHLVDQQRVFWEAIFQKFSTEEVLIHDELYPAIVIDRVDFRETARKINSNRAKANYVAKYINRYEVAVKRFKKLGIKAREYGPIEARLEKVYKRSGFLRSRLLTGQARLRSQSGLANEFKEAFKRAQPYIPFMESVFIKQGIPKELTRIAFVESMFNKKAYSKVGASGIWQFMPRTAKHYMTVNNQFDERLSPHKATIAAAKYLTSAYRRLKSWPHAVTSYNHGVAGMARAIRKVSSDDFDQVLKNYGSKTFGFASRNFYSEFLAANKTYQFLKDKSGASNKKASFAKIRLSRQMSVAALATRLRVKPSRLRENVPCILPRSIQSASQTIIPRGYEIYLPTESVKHLFRSPGTDLAVVDKGVSLL